VAVDGLADAAAITCGATSACARVLTGGVFCWGGNERGQLGDGSMVNRTSRVAVMGL
jgi:alpha-tubulin suppressor-like RCC1 family protein